MSHVVRKHDEVLAGIERLPVEEQLAGKAGAGELRASPAGAVHDQDRVSDDPLRILLRGAIRAVVHPQLRQRLTRVELEILDDEVALGGLQHGRRLRVQRDRDEQRQQARSRFHAADSNSPGAARRVP